MQAKVDHNGLGDRLSQNGVNYTLDLNAGLTEVLNDGTNQYLYGVGRIAQVNITTLATDYFLGDALGSVRQLTDAGGAVTYASAYDPYGVTTQTFGASQTSYGFTGELTDPSGMVYLRARYYTPNNGRFLTRDMWDGDYRNPMSFNRWMYVYGNPINRIDPSGNVPCSMLPPDDQVNCIAVPPPPNWFVNQTQLYVDGLGYFDSGHLGRGWDSAEWFVREIKRALDSDEEYRNEVSRRYSGMLPLAPARSNKSPYWVDYVVSARITDAQIYGVAYGMFTDFERGYETYQANLPWWEKQRHSGFAPADLPSDHLGFWAYMSGYERDEIPTLVQCLGDVQVISALNGVGGFKTNHEFLPMIREETGSGSYYRNIAWPAFLEIQPIPSGPNTWQVLRRSH